MPGLNLHNLILEPGMGHRDIEITEDLSPLFGLSGIVYYGSPFFKSLMHLPNLASPAVHLTPLAYDGSSSNLNLLLSDG